MNVVEILETEAFNQGSDLWVVKNDTNNKWWQELDFKSGFLLSQCIERNKKSTPQKLTEILELTDIKKLHFSEDPDFLLVGSSAHFLNKWILIWNSAPEKVSQKIIEILAAQKTNTVRFFSDAETIMSFIEARPKASVFDISYIENT